MMITVVNSIFFLRYCDKNKYYGNCCIERGIEKYGGLSEYFTSKNINITDIYASNSVEKCDMKFKVNEGCQYSNRTYILTRMSNNNLKTNVKHFHYCLGDEEEIFQHIKVYNENLFILWKDSLILTFSV